MLALVAEELDACPLMLWALSIAAMVAAGLLHILMPAPDESRTEGRRATRLRSACRWALGTLGPRAYVLDTAWQRLDQHERVVETLAAGAEPGRRGWWRLPPGTVRLRDCFGCWTRTRRLDATQERLIPPNKGAVARRSRLRSQRPAHTALDLTRATDAGVVRPYEKGDPIGRIAWRQSAHHATLMTRTLETRRRETPLVIVDTLTCPDADALAQALGGVLDALARQGVASGAIMVTEGTRAWRGAHEARRLVCALERDRVADIEHAARERGAQARTLMSRPDTPVVLVTAEEDGPLARAVRAQVPELTTVRAATPAGAAGTAPARRRAPAARRPRTPVALEIAAAVAVLVLMELTLELACRFIEPGTWSTLARGTFALVALEATIGGLIPCCRRVGARLVLKLVCAVAVIAAAYVAAHRTVAVLGIDLAGASDSWRMLGSWASEAPGPLSALISQGVGDLYFGQWVPLTLTPAADGMLCLAIGAILALVLGCLASVSVLRPLLAAPPVVLATLMPLLMVEDPPAFAAPLAAGAGILLIACDGWLLYGDAPAATPAPRPADTMRGRATRLAQHILRTLGAPVVLGAASLAVATVLLPSSFGVVGLAPIDLGLTPTTFSGSTVNPIIDLRRELNQGLETDDVTYTTDADHPLYLRLTTMGGFDGKTWIADAGTASTGIPLIDQLLPATALPADVSPALPGANPAPDALALAVASTGQAVGPAERISATLTVGALSSSFTPVPVGTFDTADASGGESTWMWEANGAVSGTAPTTRGLTYTVTSAYLAPLTTVDAVDATADLPLSIARTLAATTPSGWREAIDAGCDGRYLGLPDELPENMAAFVADAQAAGVPTDGETFEDELAAVRHLVAYFTDGSFSYTLDAPDGGGADNLEIVDDLLVTRRGWCVHYAAACALLGRAMGVPTRIALGYRAAGTAEAGVFTATSHDLHAWCEVFLYGVGWVGIDVTPTADGAGADATAATTPSPETPATPETPEPSTTPDAASTAQSPADAAGGTSDGSGLAQAAAAVGAMLERALAPLAALAVAGTLLASPALIRRHRRRRRLHTLAAAGATGADVRAISAAAARAAWDELADSICDLGEAPGTEATEEDVAECLKCLVAPAPSPTGDTGIVRDQPAAAEAIDLLARAVQTVCYGTAGADLPAPEALRRAFACIDAALARAAAERVTTPRERLRALARRLLPLSVLPRRRTGASGRRFPR